MAELPGLKATLKRGALVAAANWPLVAVQFVAESTLKVARCAMSAIRMMGTVNARTTTMTSCFGVLIGEECSSTCISSLIPDSCT